jgi:HK97 family phage portal protein
MTLVVPGTEEWADAARTLPRQYREPVPIPEEAPDRELGNAGNWPAQYWPWIIDPATGWPTRTPGTIVTEYTVTGIPAAWKCLNFIANAVASCAPPIEFDSNQVRVDPLSPVVDRPWSFLGTHEYWAQAVTTVLLYGDFIGINIDVDPSTGFPRQVMPTHPNDVTMVLIEGLPWYYWAGEVFAWDEVTHVRGFTSPAALRGMGVIQAFRFALGAQVDSALYSAGMHASANENSVVIQVDRPELSPLQADQIQQAWIDRHGSGYRRPAVIPRSMTITPLAFSPADAQFLQSQQFDVAMTAFMFNMDPTDLDATVGGMRGSMTYANREQREIERITHAVGPWIRRFEQAWSDLLPGRRNIAFDIERLLRTDTKTRLESTDIALKNGTFTLNDARNIERLPLYQHEWANVPFGHPPDTALTADGPPTGEMLDAPTATPQTAEAV